MLVSQHASFERQGSAWVQIAARSSDGRVAFDLARGALVGTDRLATFELGDPAAAVIEPIVPLPLDVTPLGLPGCALGTPIDVTVALLSPAWSIPLPAFTPSLVGASFRAQALVLDSPANAFGAVLSNTLRLRAGA